MRGRNVKSNDKKPGRREFLAAVGSGALAMAVGGCGKCSTGTGYKGAASNAAQSAAVMPAHLPLRLIEPDIVGKGVIPNAYLSYPKQEFVRVFKSKPGQGGPPIKTISSVWGPTPSGIGSNSFLQAVNSQLGITVDPSLVDGWSFAQKLSAILAARDVPDVLSAPSWEINVIPRFSQAVKALFEDLTDYLKGNAVTRYRMLAAIPASAWRHCVWGGRLAAIPYPTDGPFPWAMFYRKDITEKLGIEPPAGIEALYQYGKRLTNPSQGIWAFGNTFEMVQMYFKCPSSEGGWRKKEGGGLEFKYETKEFKGALEFTARLYKEGMVHPDLVASDAGADEQQLFKSGHIMMYRDGMGGWYPMQRDQRKINPRFDMQPLPIFSAVGGEPLAWGSDAPVYYVFLKQGLGKQRTEEILRVLDWCAAPFGSQEYELIRHGVEGKHFERAPDGSPMATDLGRRELADQYGTLSGREPVLVGNAENPTHVEDLLAYTQATARYLEPNLFQGIKLEYPPSYSKLITTTEEKFRDVVRGRRPISDVDQIVDEWRRRGGNDGRGFFEKALADNGR